MNLFHTILADIEKVLGFTKAIAPIVAVADPNAASGIAATEAAINALQPTIDHVVNSANGQPMTHDEIVSGVTTLVTASSDMLNRLGKVSASTNDTVQALAPVISAAVIASGKASPATPAA